MNLKRQLLIVSLLTLVLPWAGCQFIRETESALREGQQQMLGGTAQAIADSLAQFPGEFGIGAAASRIEDQLYAHALTAAPVVDGYFDDWPLARSSLVTVRGEGADGLLALGTFRQYLFLYLEVLDQRVVYADPGDPGSRPSDSVRLVTGTTDGETSYLFEPEAPGALVASRPDGAARAAETRISAHWQDMPRGYRLEARVPRELLGEALGIVVVDADDAAPARYSATFSGPRPPRLVTPSPLLQSVSTGYVQPGLRLLVTDAAGWRLAMAGSLEARPSGADGAPVPGWMYRLYELLLEPGTAASLPEPAPLGREGQAYLLEARAGRASSEWFAGEDGNAVATVAQPVWAFNDLAGVVVLQQGTDAILSLTNRALTRLITVTLIATLVVALTLLGYATWLSARIRRLSSAALSALDGRQVLPELPSSGASDEIGDLSRSFSSVLRRLGDYNEYLRTLASKLSHELRTPLTIVTSSLDNLEHEAGTPEAREYTARARTGARRLQKILNAMGEASRVEQLVENAEPETFDLAAALRSTTAAYADAWPERRFRFEDGAGAAPVLGSPELLIQMLDKLVDNAVDFTRSGDEIRIGLAREGDRFVLSVSNPGPPLPERMRSQLFDSMVSLRDDRFGRHLGLGLFIARVVAEGHGGRIAARNTDGGVTFEVRLPVAPAAG